MFLTINYNCPYCKAELSAEVDTSDFHSISFEEKCEECGRGLTLNDKVKIHCKIEEEALNKVIDFAESRY